MTNWQEIIDKGIEVFGEYLTTLDRNEKWAKSWYKEAKNAYDKGLTLEQYIDDDIGIRKEFKTYMWSKVDWKAKTNFLPIFHFDLIS